MTLDKFETNYIPEPNSGCWLWTGAQHRQGYGSLSWKHKPMLAHRVSWEIYRGKIPDGLLVLHKCDLTCCINPDHLFLGTHSDNMFDCGKKGRSNKKGSINGNAKIDEETVRIIRRAPRRPGLLKELSERFGIHRMTVADIRAKARRSWKGIE